MSLLAYAGSCHCGGVRFRFSSEAITTAMTCNCSICIRKGALMSASYYAPEEVEVVGGAESLTAYMFGDRHMNHYFCRTCGISPFTVVASVPADYDGPARPGDYRINLGCVAGLDLAALEVTLIDGRSF